MQSMYSFLALPGWLSGNAIVIAAIAAVALIAVIVGAVRGFTRIGWGALFLGLMLFYRFSTLLVIGGVMLLVVLAFQLITLPVELNASSRALKILRADGMIMEQERPMASTMLKAAAFTYVAGVLSTLLQILRVFLIAGSRDRRN